MSPGRLPPRFDAAMAALELAPHHRVLEFGCGNGVLAAAIATRLTTGSITAIDRSPTAITRASANVTGVSFAHTDLAGFVSEPVFDRLVAVNVNLFWTGPCHRECEVLRSVLAPGGMVVLVFETPGALRPEIVDRSTAALRSAGFDTEAGHGPRPTIAVIRAELPERDHGEQSTDRSWT